MSKVFFIIFLFLNIYIHAADDLRVISSTNSYMIVEYRPNYSDIKNLEIDGLDFKKLELKHGFPAPSLKYGDPELYVRQFDIGVPSEYGNTIQVLSAEFSTIKGIVLPVPKPVNNGKSVTLDYKTSSEYYSPREETIVEFGNYGLVRDFRVQSIIIKPVQFSADKQLIKLYNKIRIRINYSNTVKVTSKSNETYLQGAILNFEESQNWRVDQNRLSKVNADSPLSNGVWYRFEAQEEGIYKIPKSLLSSLGIDNNVDPRTIKIYNNGGSMLKESPAADRSYGLIENAIIVSGEDDGVFDDQDYILFYGRSTNFWSYDLTKEDILRNKNFFSNKNYYLITSGGNRGKRMETQTSLNSSEKLIQNSTRAFQFLDDDISNLAKSGVVHVGDEFSLTTKSRTYINTLNDRIAEQPINYNFQFINYASTSTPVVVPFSIEENGTRIYTKNIAGGAARSYQYGRMYSGIAEYDGIMSDNRSVLKFTFNNSNPSAKGYLDYFEIMYSRSLNAVDDQIILFSKDTNSVIQYTLSEFSNSDIRVFDVSEFSNVKIISDAVISGGQFKFQSREFSGNISKYLGLCSTKYKTPANIQSVNNSNVIGDRKGVEYIIISHKNFSEQAERLKDYRENIAKNKVDTEIFYVDEIFNEFAGGSKDPTAIRDFLSYAFENWDIKPFYVLFFGDGDYDYFNIESQNKNFIPTYQTRESLYEIYSYPYDDYFARIIGIDNKVDLALGRLNVSSTEEAEIIIDKIIFYETGSENGLWRNTITLVADDGKKSDGDDGALHTGQSETLSKQYIPQYFDQKKIYLASYPALITGSGRRKPDVNKALINAVNSGTLILNFIGHGNPEVWTHEIIYENSVSLAQFNNDKYFFLTAATCDFGKYDDPQVQSGTEKMLFLVNAGMIGGLSASRPVYSNSNAALNNAFYFNLFFNRQNPLEPDPLGLAYFRMKQQKFNDNDEKFHLFGDPYMRLNEPHLPVSIDSVNKSGIQTEIQISALGEVSIEGSVLEADSTLVGDFNGEGILTVFDSQRKSELAEINNYLIEQQGGVIFRGRISVNDGKFKTTFRMPKDISYENKNGKIVAYVFNDKTDGIGYTKNIIVGGTDTTAIDDETGPDINIFFDDESFKDAFLVNPDFNLLVRLEDETGLNTTGTGLGHKLEGVLNDDFENPVDFTDYFIGDADAGGRSGLVKYKFNDLNTGEHKVEVKAWDVFNNFSTSEAFFSVVDENGLTVRNVVNYPNPFSSSTTFTFQHNITEPVNVKIKIYTIAGRLIQEIENSAILDKFVRIDWDGRDADYDLIANGTYFYKLIVESIDGQHKENIIGKLAVIR